MKKRSTSELRLQKCVISNLNTIKAGGPPPPPGSNTCVEEATCLTCEGASCVHTCDRTCQ